MSEELKPCWEAASLEITSSRLIVYTGEKYGHIYSDQLHKLQQILTQNGTIEKMAFDDFLKYLVAA
jgi:hypothetical protein